MVGTKQKLSKGQEAHVVDILRKKLLTWVLVGFALLGGLTGLSLFGIMLKTQNKVETLISNQFEEPQIQKLLREVAAERASNLLSTAIEPEIVRVKDITSTQLTNLSELVERTKGLEERSEEHKNAIERILSTVNSRLTTVDDELEQARNVNKELEKTANIMMLIVSAMGNDAGSWEQLIGIAEEPTNKFSEVAGHIAIDIQKRYVGPDIPPYTVMSDEVSRDVDASTIDGIKALFPRIPRIFHAHLAQRAWTDDRFTKYEKFDFLSFILTESDSLTARAIAGKHFAKESGEYFGHLRIDPWLNWWTSNSNRIAETSKNK